MKIIKKLRDNQVFRLDPRSKVTYTLQKLDKKTKKAVYTSNNSGKTFSATWNLYVYP